MTHTHTQHTQHTTMACVAGWGSGLRRPLTNPFKESFDLSPLPSTSAASTTTESEPKEKEVRNHQQAHRQGRLSSVPLTLLFPAFCVQGAESFEDSFELVESADSFELLDSSESSASAYTSPEEVCWLAPRFRL
jgi:hypothetical protein